MNKLRWYDYAFGTYEFFSNGKITLNGKPYSPEVEEFEETMNELQKALQPKPKSELRKRALELCKKGEL